jgi:hypothetical protein
MSNVLAFIGCAAVVIAILVEVIRNIREVFLFIFSIVLYLGLFAYIVWSINVGLHWFFN